MNSPPARYESRVRAFCRHVGATDLESWLGVPGGTRGPAGLAALERKRLALEAKSSSDTKAAAQAELLQDHYRMLQAVIGGVAEPAPAELPDYYATLGVAPAATFAELEQAWRRLVDSGRQDPGVAQAWRVLGDPLNRANYDRSRREQLIAQHGSAGWTVDPPTPVGSLITTPEACQVELIGPDLREVDLGPVAVTVPISLRVHGRTSWAATIQTSHPALTTSPADQVHLAPGRHTITVKIEPAALGDGVADATVTLRGGAEHLAVALRLRRVSPPGWTWTERLLMVVLGASLVSLGWWLGTRTTIAQAPHTPATEGEIAQLPSASSCLGDGSAPLPRFVDVHTDGLGRPTGFSFGGTATPDLETCMKEALLKLDFPPTRDGFSTFHRYHITRDPP